MRYPVIYPLLLIPLFTLHMACENDTPAPQPDCPEELDFGFVEFAPEQDQFMSYSDYPEIVFIDSMGEEARFELLSSIDSIVQLNFNAECINDSASLVNVQMSYRYILDIYESEIGLRIGQYRYTTVQFDLMFELDPYDPLNPYSVVGINMVESGKPYYTFAGCWLNWAMDNQRINNSLGVGSSVEINGTEYNDVHLSQFCTNGSFKFKPGFGIVAFDFQGTDWMFDRFE